MIAAFLTGIAILAIFVEFGYQLYNRTLVPSIIFQILEVLFIVLFPALFLLSTGKRNDCCSDSAFFSPDHSLTLYVLISCCIISYFYSSWRKELAGPLLELLVNCWLFIGIILNIIIGIQHNENAIPFIIHGPIILLYIIVIIKNQRLICYNSDLLEEHMNPGFQKTAWRILNMRILKKVPILIMLCFPLLAFLSVFLLLFGQKPDSAIRAFTDTYKHGFSQLDDQCINAVCPGGHFLCTIAAKGHKGLVKPMRFGRRAGYIIVCNRQLLVSNAFEELLQHKLPFIHKPIRQLYNHMGNLIHQYYGVFNQKWVSDTIYILMKPLEWLFLVVLYLFDRKPENRIASQYIDKTELHNLVNHVKNVHLS